MGSCQATLPFFAAFVANGSKKIIALAQSFSVLKLFPLSLTVGQNKAGGNP